MSMNYYSDEINPLDEAEESVESLLEALSLDVVRVNIEQQISGDISPNRDFLGVVLAKFTHIRDSKTDPEEIMTLNNEMIEFCAGLIGKIGDRYNLLVDPATDDSLEYLDLLTDLYNFFVISKEFYVTQFIIQYIMNNKRKIISSLDIGGRGGDITSQAYRRKNLPRTDVAILSRINDVIDFVKQAEGISVDEFLNTIYDADYYVSRIMYYYQNTILAGDFIHQYIDDVVDEHSSESALRIRNDIRIKLSQREGE